MIPIDLWNNIKPILAREFNRLKREGRIEFKDFWDDMKEYRPELIPTFSTERGIVWFNQFYLTVKKFFEDLK
jgi:hypothetical protein